MESLDIKLSLKNGRVVATTPGMPDVSGATPVEAIGEWVRIVSRFSDTKHREIFGPILATQDKTGKAGGS